MDFESHDGQLQALVIVRSIGDGTMGEARSSSASRSSRWIYLAGVVIFLGYAIWIIGPYLRSTFVRDAAVTTWSNTASSPIDGIVDSLPVPVGGYAGEDGIVARISNEHLSRKGLADAQKTVKHARARISEWQEFIEDIRGLDLDRADLKAQYAEVFRSQLDTHIENLSREIEVTSKQLDLVRQIADRKKLLAQGGTLARTDEDEALLRVAELELRLARLKTSLANAIVRRTPADHGVFISDSGEDPDWVRGSRVDLKVEKNQAQLELKKAEADLSLAETQFVELNKDLERQSQAEVIVPSKSLIWSQHVAPGTAVVIGSPILEWLNCSALMIDVPVSDAEVSLINPGMTAEVILEGDRLVRHARVLMTRGSAATLGREDLAAVAKGRQAKGAQVLLDFSHEAATFSSCPVGRAAYVNFPEIGLIDVVRARMRL